MGIKSLVKSVLMEQQNKKYARLLAAKAVAYDQWIHEQESILAWKSDVTSLQKIGKGNSAQVMEIHSEEDYVCICVPNGQLAEEACNRITWWLAENPECKILYGDEDIVEFECGLDGMVKSVVRKSPWFKPDWSPDLLKCSFYFGSMVTIRKELWNKMLQEASLPEIGVEKEEKSSACEIYRIIDVSRFQTFIRRCVVAAGGYQRNSHAVQHVSEVLFHGYSEELRKNYVVRKVSAMNIAENNGMHVDSCSNTKIVDTEKKSSVIVSIIIPSKDNPDILKKCLDAIPAAAGKLPYEVIIVDNGSSEENKQKIEILIQEYAITYLYHPMVFNFSKMCNMGAEAAKGDLLLFLNDDVELAQVGSLEKLAELAVQEYTGAVGIKLYYPGSMRIQHAGITNLPMGPVHKLQFLEDDKDYYFGYNRGCRNVLAVTAACLMVEKEKFTEAGGFSEELRVAFNDVDFCFRLYELGYSNVCRNDCFAYHHESLSRGDDESAEKLNRLLAERDKLYERHTGLKGVDPYYNVGLGRDGLDTRIRPAYETAGNVLQRVTGALSQINTREYRLDNCLLFRVEDSREGMVQGYGVVLGDNNACYDRWLVLERVSCNETICYAIAVEGQYRPDLVENMSDQCNVALSGFWVKLITDTLPEGQYRIGMAVRNRITGLKLINWSNRMLNI